MADQVEPSVNRPIGGKLTLPGVINNSLGTSWIVPNGERELADLARHGFDETHSGLTATIDTGEAFIEGNWLERDVTTDVTLPDDSTAVVYVGKNHQAEDTVIIGLDAAFAADDPKAPLYEYQTSGGSVSAVTDLRNLGLTVGFQMDALLGTEGIAEIEVLTESEVTAETSRRLMLVTDAGKVIWDTGSNLITLGAQPGAIALSALGSKKHSELTSVGAADHHPKSTYVGIDPVIYTYTSAGNAGTWRTQDISGAVPAEAVAIETGLSHNAPTDPVGLRKPGSGVNRLMNFSYQVDWVVTTAVKNQEVEVRFEYASASSDDPYLEVSVVGYWV